MDEQGIVAKTRASSGKVDYTKPIVIRGGEKATTHFEVLPTFVRRSEGEDVCLKLSYWKKSKGAYRVGFPAEFTLNAPEVLALRDVIEKSLGVSGQPSGQYLLIKLEDVAATNIQGKDAASIGSALLKLLANPAIGQSLTDLPSAQELLDGVQTALRVRSLASAIAELEEALDGGEVAESYYQAWCERNAWAFGNGYVMRDEVRQIALGDSVDILLKRTTDRFRDIFELKRPDHKVLVYDDSHKSYHWTSDSSRAIGQTHRYLDALHEAAANGLRDHPEVVAYYPYGTIVIGRSNEWTANRQKALHGLNNRLHSIRVITYDHLLEQAKRALAILSEEQAKA